MGSRKYPGRRRLNGRQLTAVVGVAGALALAGCGGSSGGSSGGSGSGATSSASGFGFVSRLTTIVTTAQTIHDQSARYTSSAMGFAAGEKAM